MQRNKDCTANTKIEPELAIELRHFRAYECRSIQENSESETLEHGAIPVLRDLYQSAKRQHVVVRAPGRNGQSG